MIAQTILPEFDHEYGILRKFLEIVPEDKAEFTPHEKSMPLKNLAGHCAEIAGWMGPTLEQDELDMAESDYTPMVMTNRAELLSAFDEIVANARKVLEATTDETMMSMWTMRTGETVHISMPKVAVVRGFIMNHMIHHRAQLGVYLRMNDIPLPSVYGPTADNPM